MNPSKKDELEEIKRLAGIKSGSLGSNISLTGTEKSQLMKKHKIRPGTPQWFKLWFSLPYMTGEKPI